MSIFTAEPLQQEGGGGGGWGGVSSVPAVHSQEGALMHREGYILHDEAEYWSAAAILKLQPLF